MSERQTKAGNQECFARLAKFAKLANLHNWQNDPWDMLDNFCFHVYAQKSLFIAENCNGFFLPPHHHHHPVSLEFLELVPS